MTYLLVFSMLTLSACTVIYVAPGDKGANIQTTEPINVLGSQNATSADKSAEGDATSADQHEQKAVTVPTVVLPLPPLGP